MKRTAAALALLLIAPVVCAAGQPTVQVRLATVSRHALRDTITGFGVVRPDPTALTTRDAVYAAFVQQVDVTLGQPVHRGEPLLVLRTAPAARATYLSARANVQYARQALARRRSLLREKLATRAEVESAANALQTAEAAFAAQQALGTGHKVRVIRAPFGGIVSQLPVKPGNEVQAGTQLFQLARRNRLEVALGVEPDEVGRVRVGMPVTVKPVFGSSHGVRTRVAQVNAVVDPKTRLVDVIVRLHGKLAMPFLPGMNVEGVLTLHTGHPLAVPRSAVLHDSRGGYVFVVRGRKAYRVDVKTGLDTDGLVAVTGRLKAGDRVVVQGNYELSDGMTVRPVS